MRKLIRQFIYLSIFIWAIFFIVDKLELKINKNDMDNNTSYLKNVQHSKMTYILDANGSLLFDVPSYSKEIKILSTANIIKPKKIENSMLEIRYELKYQFLDSQNRVIYTKRYHFKTNYMNFRDKDNKIVTKSFYLDKTLHPNPSQTLFINLKKHKNISKLRLVIESKDNNVVDLGIRTYYLEEIKKEKRDVKWRRMDKDILKHLSRGNIYKLENLTPIEKDSLVSKLYRPIGAIGIEKEDYKIRRLFVIKNADELHPSLDINPTFYMDYNLSATRVLSKGKYTIFLKSLSTNKIKSNIEIRQYIENLRVSDNNFSMEDMDKNISINIKDTTLIELKSDNPISIEIIDINNSHKVQIPVVTSYGYNNIDKNNSLEYKFYSYHTRYIRLEARISGSTKAMLNITMRDREDKECNITKELEFILSRYDYIKDFIPQSQALYIYLTIPKYVKSISLKSDKHLLLKVSSRTDKIDYPVYSFAQSENPKFNKLPSWFVIKPYIQDKIKIKSTRETIFKQPKPPTTNPFIIMGKFFYEQLFPINRWRGHYILVKRNLANNYIRPQSYSSLYTQVDSQKHTKIRFRVDAGVKEIKPTILYHKRAKNDKITSIYLNNEVVSFQKFYGVSGTIKLPINNIDRKHDIYFSPNKNIDFYINHFTNTNTTIYLKRNFLTFDKPLIFKIKKRTKEESIGFQIAINKTEKRKILPFRIEIDANTTITKPHLYQGYTFKRYKLYADIFQQRAIHIAYYNKILSLSKPMYIKLGANLPIGEYTIKVYPPKISTPCYLFINHIILNQNAKTGLSSDFF